MSFQQFTQYFSAREPSEADIQNLSQDLSAQHLDPSSSDHFPTPPLPEIPPGATAHIHPYSQDLFEDESQTGFQEDPDNDLDWQRRSDADEEEALDVDGSEVDDGSQSESDFGDSDEEPDEGGDVAENDYDEFNDVMQRARKYHARRKDAPLYPTQSQGEELRRDIQEKLQRLCCKRLRCTTDRLDVDSVLQHVQHLRSLKGDHKEMYIMGLLDTTYPRGEQPEHKRPCYAYSALGHEVCRTAFEVAHDLRKFKLDAIINHLRHNGPTPRINGNTGRVPKHALNLEDTRCVIQYIASYSSHHGEEQPAPPGRAATTPQVYLDATLSKAKIYDSYKMPLQQVGQRFVALRTFRDIWKTCMPHVKLRAKKDDVCTTCWKNKNLIDYHRKHHNIPRVRELQNQREQHRARAQEEFRLYKANEKAAQDEYNLLIQQNIPYALRKFHYTFDFAQSVQLPYSLEQPGAAFYKAARKLHIFGVRYDGAKKQRNYCIDEANCMEPDGEGTHGCNAVVSMLHDAVEKAAGPYGDTAATFMADNCNSQNKNNTVLAYLAWRTWNTRHDSIEVNFLVPGHTKCAVDGGFGLIKQQFRKSKTDTLQDFVRVVNESASSNYAVSAGWKWKNWRDFFKKYFRPIPHLLSYFHFRFSRESIGVVECKARIHDDWTQFQMLKRGVNPRDLELRRGPREVIPPGGLSLARQKYLFTKVRFLVNDRSKKEQVCPKWSPECQDTPEDQLPVERPTQL